MILNTLKVWFVAIRPKTLVAGVCPVMIASGMAFGDGVHHIPTALLCLLGALTIQIGTNLANDYYDAKHGVDTQDRKGPTRVTQAGLISQEKVKRGFICVFIVTAFIALILARRGGMPVVILGIVAILSGILYTAGPYPLGYIGLGDLFVFIFFGPVAVAYTYYLQSSEMNAAVIIAGIAPGFLSVAILTINNLRDIASDAQTGKRTLVVKFGKYFAYGEYFFSITMAVLTPIIIYMMINDHKWILLSCFVSILAIPLFIQTLTVDDEIMLNPVLGQTGGLLLIYSVLFSIGWVL